MKILFIYPSDSKTYNAGIGYLSSVVKAAGHQSRLYMTDQLDTDALELMISQWAPNIIAFSSVTNQFPLTKRIISFLRPKTKALFIIGGIHATLVPDQVLTEAPGIDILCRGEGEGAILDLVTRLEAGQPYSDIQNLWVRDGKRVMRNPLRPLIQNLDELPLPDYDIFDYDKILSEMGVFMFFANRGCPYECSYCVNHSLIKLYKGEQFVRYMSVSHCIENLESLMKKYPQATTLEFFDDTFILNRHWIEEFATLYPQKIGKPFYCNVRANLIDEAIVESLKKAGCTRVNIAIETGNEDLRRNVLKKNVTNDTLEKAFSLFHQAGIKTYAHNMVGIPFETVDSIKETIQFNQKVKVDDLQCWVFYPYPGSDAYELCHEKKWIVPRYFDTVAGSIVTSTLDQPSITQEEVSYYHRVFPYLVLGNKISPEKIPLDYLYLGIFEGQMIAGWNNLEEAEGLFFRWTAVEGSLYLKNTKKDYISIQSNFPAPVPPPLVDLIINGMTIAQFIPQRGKWTWFETPIPHFETPLLEVQLRVDKPYLPALQDKQDFRELGIAISKVLLETSYQRLKRKYYPSGKQIMKDLIPRVTRKVNNVKNGH